MINWQEEAEKHIFVTLRGHIYHILDENMNLCCGKKFITEVSPSRMPASKGEICKICWRNRPYIEGD